MKKHFVYLVGFFTLLGIVSLACGISVDPGASPPEVVTVVVVATQPPAPTPVPPTPVPPSSIHPTVAPPPTMVQESPTPEPQRFLQKNSMTAKRIGPYF